MSAQAGFLKSPQWFNFCQNKGTNCQNDQSDWQKGNKKRQSDRHINTQKEKLKKVCNKWVSE